MHSSRSRRQATDARIEKGKLNCKVYAHPSFGPAVMHYDEEEMDHVASRVYLRGRDFDSNARPKKNAEKAAIPRLPMHGTPVESIE